MIDAITALGYIPAVLLSQFCNYGDSRSRTPTTTYTFISLGDT